MTNTSLVYMIFKEIVDIINELSHLSIFLQLRRRITNNDFCFFNPSHAERLRTECFIN